jgi:hypothetical protein
MNIYIYNKNGIFENISFIMGRIGWKVWSIDSTNKLVLEEPTHSIPQIYKPNQEINYDFDSIFDSLVDEYDSDDDILVDKINKNYNKKEEIVTKYTYNNEHTSHDASQIERMNSNKHYNISRFSNNYEDFEDFDDLDLIFNNSRITTTNIYKKKLQEKATMVKNSLTKHKNICETNECTICITQYKDKSLYILSCNHDFCTTCLDLWIDNGHDTCPICRANI